MHRKIEKSALTEARRHCAVDKTVVQFGRRVEIRSSAESSSSTSSKATGLPNTHVAQPHHVDTLGAGGNSAAAPGRPLAILLASKRIVWS